MPRSSTTVFVYFLKLPPCACPTTELTVSLAFHTLVRRKQATRHRVSDRVCVFVSMVENGHKKGKWGALSRGGSLFGLGFSTHVDTPNSFYPQCSQETTALPLLLMVHVVKMLLPHPPPLLFTLLPQPSSFPHSCFLACLACAPLPRKFAPMFCLFTSRCVRFTRRACAMSPPNICKHVTKGSGGT